MNQQEKQIGTSLLEAYKMLSVAKKEYLLGFAEGVAAATAGAARDALHDNK